MTMPMDRQEHTARVVAWVASLQPGDVVVFRPIASEIIDRRGSTTVRAIKTPVLVEVENGEWINGDWFIIDEHVIEEAF